MYHRTCDKVGGQRQARDRGRDMKVRHCMPGLSKRKLNLLVSTTGPVKLTGGEWAEEIEREKHYTHRKRERQRDREQV